MDKAIADKLDLVATGIETIQKEHKNLGDQVKAHEGLQALVKSIGDNLEEVQKARQAEAGERAAVEALVKDLQKRIARGVGANGADGVVDEFKQYGDEFTRYLRKGYEIDSKISEECVRGMIEKNFRGLSAEEISIQTKDMLAGNNPAGGYMIRPEVSSRMIKRIFETSPLRSVCSVMTIASDSVELLIDDNEAGSGGWVGEVDPRSITDTPQVGKLIIEAHELFAQPRATQKFLDDAGIDVESWLSGKVTARLSRDENTAFMLGNGALKPKGLLAYADADSYGTYQRGKIQTLASIGAAIEGDDMKLLQNGIKEEYQARAVWLMNRATFGDVITLKASGNGEYIMSTEFLRDRDERILLGKGVVFCNDMPQVAEDALAVAYGDFFEGYTIVDRTGFRVIRDMYTNKPYVLFYTTKRTGGDVTSYDSWNRLRMSPAAP